MDLYTVSVWLLPVLVAITLHEAAHGYVAWRLGDDTAKRLGRVTFNPLRHIDPMGTVIIPALLIWSQVGFVFGWAKPVPVNFDRLHNPRRDMVWVAVAGPGINIALALISGAMVHLALLLPAEAQVWAVDNLRNSILINLVLAIFNMIPMPPLDGGRVAVGLLPRRIAEPLSRMERFGLFVIIAVFFVLPWIGRKLSMDINIFAWVVGTPLQILWDAVARITGLR